MCDTMVALPGCTNDGSMLFAKNSDREPNEPHIIVRVPSRRIEAGDSIRCTYISVSNSLGKDLLTNAAILFKPSWMWGAEMGVNEKGLVIGNEAVFTREKVEDNTLLGMDALRLALEMCSNAKEALNYITALIEKYGQGGKAGYTQNLKYHNSYIIADFFEAYVLETAGRHWVYEKVKDIYSISNTLSIRNKFEGFSSQLVEHTLTKGWCRSREEFDFKNCYESKLHPHFTKGDIRRAAAEKYLREKMGLLSVTDMKAILRSHGGKDDVGGFRNGSMECVCMHAGGGLITSQTTGSFVVQLKDGKINIWATASSIPCISVFKPIWFIGSSDEVFTEQNQEGLVEYWRDIELFHRHILSGDIKGLERYINERNLLEKELEGLAEAVDTDERKTEITLYAIEKEKEIISEIMNSEGRQLSKKVLIKHGSLYYRIYWTGQNRKLYRKSCCH
jgi:secernin